MKKLSLFMLMAVGLLISGNAWAEETTYSISSQDNAQSQVEAWLADTGDATLIVGDNVSVSFANAQNITTGIKTINLNGHELIWTNTWAGDDVKENKVVVVTGQYVINITTGTLKIKDQASGGKLSMISSYDYGWTYGIYLNNADGKFVMESGQISYAKATTPEYVSRITPLCVYGNGSVDISGGSIEMKDNNSYGAYLAGNIDRIENLDVYCAEGFSSSASSIYAVYANVKNTASLTMDNCSFDLSRVTSEVKTYALFITGSNATTTMQNPTFTAGSNNSTKYSIYNSGSKVYIEGGNFVGEVYSITSASGGTFSTTIPEKMIASGYVCVPQNDKFVVRAATNAEKVIKLEYPKETPTTTEYHASLYHAVAAAEAALGSKATNYKLTINSNYSYSSWPFIYGTLIVPAGIELTGDASATIYGTLENYGTINCPITTGAGGRINNHTGAILSVGGCTISKDAILTNDGTLNIGGSASISAATATKSGDVYVKSASAGKLENNGTINIAANAKITVSKKSGYALQCEECEDAIFVNNGIVLGTDNTSKLALSAPATGTGIGSSYGQIPAEANTYAWVSATNSWEIAGNVINITTQVGYDQLSDAISYANANDELKLMANGNASGQNIEKAVTIDLNGHTISAGYTPVSDRGQAFTIKENGVLTIKDGSATAPASIDEDGNLVYDGGKITAASGNGTILVRNGGILNLQGGIIEQTSTSSQTTYAAIEMTNTSNRSQGAVDAQVNISGGAVKAGQVGIMIYGTGSTTSITEHAPQINISSGVIMGERGYAICGLGTQGFWDTKINIDGGYVYSKEAPAIYNPQYGQINITNGTIKGYHSAIEIRAGELNISGGTLTSIHDGFECEPNGSGITTAGAALAIAQHTTKQPITVNISGGHFNGYYAVSQCNPQQNPDEYLDLLNIEVTGGYFRSTNGANIISVTENRRLFLKGGVYNLNPSAFVVDGYFSLDNQPELYPGSYAQGYVYKVAQQDITEEQTKSDGTTDWAQNTTWNTDLVPDYATNVTIGKDIEVTTSAEANKITIEEGATLTVKDGGTLIIGNGGIMGATDETFKVEAGGQVLIAPNAEHATIRGSVDLLADRAGLKPGETYTGQGSEMYWQHIAIPTQGAPESITPNVTGKTFFNTWDIVKGWQNVGTTALNESFKGYNLGNFHPYSADGSQSITYTFVGNLVGNQPDYMVFAREGHSFFGNSYLAPLDVATMFGTLYNPELEYTLNIYDSQSEMYQPVNEATYSILGINEIKPLQGFFIYAANATQAQLDYNSAVFTAYLNNHAVGGQTAAPVRKAAKTNTYDKMAQITIAATTGEKDAIYLFEEANFSDAEDNGFDARNLEHSGLDMSVAGSFADLSVLATDNLEGALLNINTNNAVEYTMTFSHVQGDMTLTDNMTGVVIALQEGATYTFAAQPNAQLNGRFAINADRKVPTNMDKVKAAPAAKGIYTIMGQYVGEATNWNALPAGIYIVDGVRVSK